MKREPPGPRTLSRRQLLRAASGLALGGVALRAGQARAQQASVEPGIEAARSLAFRHTHTGEELSLVYADVRGRRPAALERINELLRDFRTGEVHPIDPALLDLLSDLQGASAGPFEVISGYRSPRTNASLRRWSSGVAEHSFHMQGRAIDVRLPGLRTADLARRAQALQGGGVGFYKVSDFVHVDTGPLRGWGDPHG